MGEREYVVKHDWWQILDLKSGKVVDGNYARS
jgi:hypothetical protein